jgi:biopolymer transport protein TolQ
LQTLWVCALALQELAGPAAESVESGTDVISLISRTGLIEQLVLALLVLFSVLSWGIVLYKMWAFRKAEGHTKQFLDVFRRSSKFSEVQAVCRSLGESPLVGLFQAGYTELNTQLRGATGDKPSTATARPTLKSLDAVDRALLRASSTELTKLEQRVGFLATTASITPFIGLFGTVWGIMTAFQAIGAVGSSNLAVVAPGIASALIATAAGLFAAIPAVFFYNHFTSKVRGFASQMEDFSLEFLNISERNFT